MFIESFEAKNFRSLRKLELKDLARINLLVGKNNSGKTSVLEALYLFTGANVASWIDHIDNERRIPVVGFAFLFYRFDSEEQLSIGARIRLSSYSSHLMQPYDIKVYISALPSERMVNALPLPGLLEEEKLYRFDNGLNEPIRAIHIVAESTENPNSGLSSQSYSYQQRWLERGQRKNEKDRALAKPAFGQWVGTLMSIPELYARIEYLQIRKQEKRIIEILKLIDPRINKIVLASESAIYFDLGEEFPDLLPFNLMGDGVQRLLAIIAAIAHTNGAVIEIDEIDNGLHYSALRILWKGILRAAREYDVQIFATTHSAEALRHLTWVLDDEEFKDYRDDVAAYTLIRAKDDTVRSYRYNYEQLDFAMEHDMEVRN